MNLEPSFLGRGFARWEPTDTSYGATVEIYESGAASGPYIWLYVNQPAPEYPIGGLPQVEATAHMSLDQAKEIHAKLGAAIEFMSTRFAAPIDK